ncbi:MAG: helix-turn-helix domain-containing protein [Gammaproteobacteria bacterium]
MLRALINRLKSKEFRDAFVKAHLTQGLAYQIRDLRIQRGWTQKELAEKLGLKGQSAVARMEDPSYGKLSLATLIKLSSIFDVALSVRFQSYGKFMIEREDLSHKALQAESFENEIPKIIDSMEAIVPYIPIEMKHQSNGYQSRVTFSNHPTIYEKSDSFENGVPA